MTNNEIRQHFVAEWTAEEQTTKQYLRLARGITDITDDSEEEQDDTKYYDGTNSNDVIDYKEKWTVEGHYSPEDKAQMLIAGKKRKLGQDRYGWHKYVTTDGKTYEGVVSFLDIKAGSGTAGEKETFSCAIAHQSMPVEIKTGA